MSRDLQKQREWERKWRKKYYLIPENKKKHDVLVKKWYVKNREKMRQYAKEYWARPEKKLKNRDSKLREDYGITLEQYNILQEAQNNLCALCNQSETRRGHLSVDHDHKTGKVRALLCHKCNTAIGMLNEDVALMQRVIEYINKHSQ